MYLLIVDCLSRGISIDTCATGKLAAYQQTTAFAWEEACARKISALYQKAGSHAYGPAFENKRDLTKLQCSQACMTDTSSSCCFIDNFYENLFDCCTSDLACPDQKKNGACPPDT